MKISRLLLFFLVICFCFVLFIGIGSPMVVMAEPKEGGSIIFAQSKAPRAIDPNNFMFDRHSIALGAAIFDRMLYYDSVTGEVLPGLCKEWSESEDGLEYILVMQEGINFHDGTPLNAEAVKFTLDRIMEWENGAKYRLGDYDHSEVLDEYTLKIIFSAPLPSFIMELAADAGLSPVSPSAVRKYGNEEFEKYLVGCGPFMVKEYVLRDHITIIKNPDYNWASSYMQHQGLAYLDEISVNFIVEPGTRIAALETDTVQLINYAPSQELARLDADPKYEVVAGTIKGHPTCFQINVSSPPTDDKRVRQAMGWSLDRNEIVDIVWNGMVPISTTPLAKGTPGYVPELEGKYAGYDPEKATTLLDSAGWKMGPSGYREKNNKILEVNIFLFENRLLGEIIQAQWKKVGIKANVVMDSLTTWNVHRKAGIGGDLSFMRWTAIEPRVITQLYLSTNAEEGNNMIFQKNEELDELLLAGQREINPDKRYEYYKAAQEIICEEAYSVILYMTPQIHAMRSNIGGFHLLSKGVGPVLYDLYLKK
ncbi:Glutathione-binding protein GsiB [subsurface metagenome]